MQADAASPQWHHLPTWSAASHLADSLVHAPASSRLHLHVYVTPLSSAHPSSDAQPSESSDQAAEGQESAESGLHDLGRDGAGRQKHATSSAGSIAQSHPPVSAEHLVSGELGS